LLNGWAYLVSGGKKFVKGSHFYIEENFTEKPEQIPESLLAEVQSKIK
jgi:hypothetical protein